MTSKRIEIVKQQIKFCEDKLKEPGCDVEMLTKQITLRQQLLKDFEK
jgi:hypothetical protein